ncbi:hypothetical protein ACFWJV_12250 [Streptomyces rochei]|uniref:hypothetical protein n=1 Tax=Streptomyces rochei TaxID=1928 RepID=UPI003652BE6E
MLVRIRTALGAPPRLSRHWERHTRAVVAAFAAAACLLLAANAGPARPPAPAVEQEVAPVADPVPEPGPESVVTVGH